MRRGLIIVDDDVGPAVAAENDALQRVEEYRKPLLDAQVYPLAFIWKSDFMTTLRNILQDALAAFRALVARPEVTVGAIAGHSMGGYVAFAVLRHAPAAVERDAGVERAVDDAIDGGLIETANHFPHLAAAAERHRAETELGHEDTCVTQQAISAALLRRNCGPSR